MPVAAHAHLAAVTNQYLHVQSVAHVPRNVHTHVQSEKCAVAATNVCSNCTCPFLASDTTNTH